jgi:hypothetical protein
MLGLPAGNNAMRLVMTLLVRDEVDIVAANVKFHLQHGVDFVVATDNGSVDGTRDALAELEKTGQVRVFDERGDDFSQGRWVTKMALLARDKYGADWILNNDADEFWRPSDGDLKTDLAESDAAIIRYRRRNMMFPHDRSGTGPWYEDLVYRVAEPYPKPALEDRLSDPLPVPYFYFDLAPKAMCRARGLKEVHDGNHNATHDRGARELHSSVQIYHYPVRSFDQFVRKIQNGGGALARNTTLPQQKGWQWRRWYRMLLEGDAERAFKEVFPSEQRLLDDLRAGRILIDESMTGKIGALEGSMV